MENLRIIRDKRNITQLNLSVKIGVAQETISGYEMGKSFPSADILIKMADTLNTSVDYLLGRTDNDRPINIDTSKLSKEELNLICDYKGLSTNNKIKLTGYIQALKDN